PNLNPGVDLAARYHLALAVDGAEAVVVDLRASAANVRPVKPPELVAAINEAFSSRVASTDGNYLILTSPSTGSGISLELRPLERTRHRKFVPRALVTDEASQVVFGAVQAHAYGTPATTAKLVGAPDLSHGIDLRDAANLRITIDDGRAREINCAGKR